MSGFQMRCVEMSPEQLLALNKIKRGENVFVTGQAGTGKTELIKAVVKHASENGIQVQVCALTGCAAILLGAGATTLHSFLGIGLATGDTRAIVATAIKKRHKMQKVRATKLLIIDEVSMMSKKLFDIVNRVTRESRTGYRPFGGLQLMFTGDFMQLPPISTIGDPDTALFCFQSPEWNELFAPDNQIELTTVFRQEDPVYRKVLSETRLGQLSDESVSILESRLNVPFDSAEHNGCVATKIFATRANVDHLNRLQYGKLPGSESVFESQRISNAQTYVETGLPIPEEKRRMCELMRADDKTLELTKLFDTSNFVNILRIKIGTVVMCTANVDMDIGICNGSQGVVVGITTTAAGQVPVVKFHNGVVRSMTMHRIQSQEYPCLVVSQIPLVHAWAISIHKCQGATMDIAEIDVGSTVFEFGQTYVALSRVKTLGGLYLSKLDVSRVRANPVVRAFYETLARTARERLAIDQASPSIVSEEAPEAPEVFPEVSKESVKVPDVVRIPISFDSFRMSGQGDVKVVKLGV